jgi:hypothetical protein
MKWRTNLRLLAVPLLTVLLLTSLPSLEAMALQGTNISFRKKEKEKDSDKDKEEKSKRVPEGSAGAVLVLAAGTLGGALLFSRRKRRATAA